MMKLRTKAWYEEDQDILVGAQVSTSSIVRIFLQRDGGMSGPDRIHQLRSGRSAEDEAASVFGLSKVRRFAVSNAVASNQYAAELRREIRARPRERDLA